MRLIRPSEHRRMPWKNGGGTTSEILVEPGDGAPDRFLYRLSIADVTSDGPFSRFDGYDRHIVLLDGAGMTLDAGAHGLIALTRHHPRSFSGDWDVNGTLVSGPVRDLNLIVDRARASAELELRTVGQATTVEAPVCIVHVLDGTLTEGAGPGSTLVAQDALTFVPAESAIVAIARIVTA